MKLNVLRIIRIAFFLLAFGAGIGMACAADTLSLNGPWTLSFWPQPSHPVTSPRQMKGLGVRRVPAMVPGNVEIDLQRAGLIDDPMKGSNVDNLRPWESFQWCYSRLFKAPSGGGGKRVILHFGGIDCLADVWLNGKFVGRAENMLIAHDFDVTSLLRSGSNSLEVILRSAVLEAQQEMLVAYAKEHGLMITRGSDFHSNETNRDFERYHRP